MLHDDSGRFTIESTIIFPLIFIITMSCLFITISVSQQVRQTIDATNTAERASYSWTNSYKDPLTGGYHPGLHDDLYWRISEDRSGSELVDKKLSNAFTLIQGQAKQNGLFKNSMIERDIDVKLMLPIHPPGFMSQIDNPRVAIGVGHSTVSEPVEFIRQLELARTYWPMISKLYSTGKANSDIEDFRKRSGTTTTKDQLVFRSHDEARAYLQQIVHGHLDRRNTEAVGSWRLIDALDSKGVAHQAYYGFKDLDGDTEFQLMKDVEILSKGKVSGVVWHFFRRESDQSIGLSNKLRSQLEERGIVIVVHE